MDPTINSGLGDQSSAAAVLTNKRGLSASLPEVLGAIGISLAVLATVGLGIGAAVNFGNDSSAKGALESVKSAQLLYQAEKGTFGTLEQLTAGDTPALTGAGSVKVSATATNYCAVVKSTSMSAPTFWITAKSGKLLTTAPTAAQLGDVTCPTA